MADEMIRTFVVDGEPRGVAWIDFGYKMWPKVTTARSLGAIPYVPEAALEAADEQRDQLQRDLDRLLGIAQEALAVLGQDGCGQEHCEGCEAERAEAARLLKEGVSNDG